MCSALSFVYLWVYCFNWTKRTLAIYFYFKKIIFFITFVYLSLKNIKFDIYKLYLSLISFFRGDWSSRAVSFLGLLYCQAKNASFDAATTWVRVIAINMGSVKRKWVKNKGLASGSDFPVWLFIWDHINCIHNGKDHCTVDVQHIDNDTGRCRNVEKLKSILTNFH